MTTIQEVSAMLPLLTPYSMPADSTQAQTLYDIADGAVKHDISGATDTDTARAYCYFIAHLLSAKDGSSTITSEHLGNWSASYASAGAGKSKWLAEYETLKESIVRPSLIIGSRVSEIEDTEMFVDYPLDGARHGC